VSDPGKGSARRKGAGYESEHERIFGKKKVTAGRHYYRWDSEARTFVEIPAPRPLQADLRFDGTFQSPVTGEVISNRYDLDRHNKEHGVEQILPGMDQDQAAVRADNHDKAFGKQAKKERVNDVIRAIEQGERSA